MISNNEFKHNHYVPEWYQRRFMQPSQGVYHYLDLKPETVVKDGHKYTRKALLRWGPGSCFAQDDLYTVKEGGWENTEIEQFFFGEIDRNGKAAVEYFDGFAHPSANEAAFLNLMTHMSVQKLRTPKGLGWLALLSRNQNRNLDLIYLQQIKNIFCAIWTECIWQIADARQSPTKFIISDHPVTVYNRACFPSSPYCKEFNDPNIIMVGTHTYFPLSIDKVLILTNLSWVRNPYQSERNIRPNPDLFREAMFKYTDIQTFRSLSEQEVLQINYITKSRALRYIAAAEKEWLYPEKYLSSTHWRNFGSGYLLMPDPRDIYMGGEIYIGYNDGRHDAFGEYGHKPWQDGFKDKRRHAEESKALERFKAEFAYMQGPVWRGTSGQFHHEGPYIESEESYRSYLKKGKEFRDADRRRRR